MRPFFGDGFGTFLALLKALLRNRKWNFTLNGKRELSNCNHLLFTRMPYIAGGIKIDLPDLKDDEFVVWYLQDISRRKWLSILPGLYRGDVQGHLEILKESVRLECPEACPVEFDGDPHGSLPLEISFSSRKLNLICRKEGTEK